MCIRDRPIAYSWLGHDDPQNIVDELLLHTNYKFDTKLGLDSFFVEAPEYFSAGKTPAGARAWAMPDISLAFRDYIYQGLYADSTVSFITEPNFFENGNILTEKTLIPIYAGHFPIWPGSYKSAETTKKIGFDVFDDIIDHSYQYLAHPGERIIQAITKNIDLLNNLELQQHYREIYEDRLNANLQLARDVTQLQQNILNNLDQHAIVHDFKDIRLFKVA